MIRAKTYYERYNSIYLFHKTFLGVSNLNPIRWRYQNRWHLIKCSLSELWSLTIERIWKGEIRRSVRSPRRSRDNHSPFWITSGSHFERKLTLALTGNENESTCFPSPSVPENQSLQGLQRKLARILIVCCKMLMTLRREKVNCLSIRDYLCLRLFNKWQTLTMSIRNETLF